MVVKKKRTTVKHRRPATRRVWLWVFMLVLLALSTFFLIFERSARFYIREFFYNHSPISDPNQNALDSNFFVPKAEIYGIDVSRHQGKIDWESLSKFQFDNKKITFAFIKATESDHWVDKRFEYNWESTLKYDIVRGAYHFFDSQEDPKKQIALFTSKVALSKGDLPPVLDVEEESQISVTEYRKRVLMCLQLIENHYGVIPILYTSQKFYEIYFNTSDFSKYPLWIPRLQNSPPEIENWILWQFSHSFSLPHILDQVDMNVFNGNLADFESIRMK
jgi:lysozyme